MPDIVEINYIDDLSVLQAPCSEPGGNGRCNPQRFRPAADRVLRNFGNGNFAAWGVEQLTQIPGYGFSATITNFDDQYGNDLFVSNDSDPNHLWLSQAEVNSGEDFSLVQRAQLLGCATGLLGNPQSCMGIATGDFDRNGRIDLHVTNYTEESSDLYLQRLSGIFEDEYIRYGLEDATRPMVGWGTQAADFNADGWLDLAIVNGHLYSHLTDGHPYQMLPQLFQGSRAGFSEVTPEPDEDPFWRTPSLGRALAAFDWNRDGRIDLVAYDLDAPAALLENRTTAGNWLQLQLIGTISERDAVGAKVIIQSGADRWTGWVTSGGSFLCANEAKLHFGIGEQESIDTVTITWPSGRTEQHSQLDSNRSYQLVEGQAEFLMR